MDDLKEVILYEIRENRKAIAECKAEVASLKISVFANKVKLGGFIAGLTFIINLIIEKFKTHL